jgi:hypothetical protein
MAAVMEDSRQALVERLFAGYAGVLRAFLRRRVGQQTDTDELCQEVFFRMLRIPDERVIENPERYLFVVARNLVHEYRMWIPSSGYSGWARCCTSCHPSARQWWRCGSGRSRVMRKSRSSWISLPTW